MLEEQSLREKMEDEYSKQINKLNADLQSRQ